MTDEPMEPTEEELRAALEEQMKRLSVKDVLLQTVITLVNLGARKLGLAGDEEERNLGEARAAIDAVRALVPLLPEREQTAVREPLSQLQLRYAQEATAGQRSEVGGQRPEEEKVSAEEAERAKARSKIWTPPGA